MEDIKSVSFVFRRDAWTRDMNVDIIGGVLERYCLGNMCGWEQGNVRGLDPRPL